MYMTGSHEERLAIEAVCTDWVGGGVIEGRPIPSFTAKFTFATTDVDALPTTPFN